MDPVTHAASGAVVMLALRARPATRWAVPFAALAAALPDIDVCFAAAFGPLQFLQLHRGITHSLAAMPLLGLLLALCCRPLWHAGTPGRWSFCRVWLFACCMVLLHIWLDAVTTYGTMIFLPFSHERVRLNGLFIVDLLFVLPLLLAIWRAHRVCMLAACVWLVAYPGLNIALNARHAATAEARLASEGREVSGLTVLPDAFAPFFWRVIFEERGLGERGMVCEQSLDVLGRPRAPEIKHAAFPEQGVAKLSAASAFCREFFAFTMLPVFSGLAPGDRPQDSAGKEYFLFYDLRFGSGHAFVRDLMRLRPEGDRPFQLMLEFGDAPDAPVGKTQPSRERLRFSGNNKDSGWQTPVVPKKPSLWRWLAGLR
ncbi:MAG: metal-dependent hydrolase [Desulfovibrio sp.]|nr:metal-dependent hydrolase [Desulfovibrio sp.]